MQDDMELAPDFFTYFEALAPMLSEDDMLMCISSWNDHGQVGPSHMLCLKVMALLPCSLEIAYANAMWASI